MVILSGVTRLTMSLTVIMVEITNDIHQLLLIMITIMVAKWTGDLLSHPLYQLSCAFETLCTDVRLLLICVHCV